MTERNSRKIIIFADKAIFLALKRFLGNQKLRKVMSLACKSTKALLNTHQPKVENLLDVLYLDHEAIIDEQYTLDLNVHYQPASIHKFLIQCHGLSMPATKMLRIEDLFWLSEQGVSDFNEFLQTTMTNSLQKLSLTGGGEFGELFDIGNIIDGLKFLLPLIKVEIDLHRFHIDQRHFVLLLQYARNCKTLKIRN